MNPRLTKAFQNIECECAPEIAQLQDNIWQSVVAHDKKITRIKFYLFACVGLVSLYGLIVASHTLSNDLTRSGIFEYISLMFSSTGLAMTYWKELSFSIAESLPITSIIFILSILFVFFFSLKHFLRQMNKSNHVYGRFRIGQLSF